MTNFARYIDIKQNEVASKHFKNFFSLTDPRLQNFHHNNNCNVTKAQKTKLHIYFKKQMAYLRDNAFITFID